MLSHKWDIYITFFSTKFRDHDRRGVGKPEKQGPEEARRETVSSGDTGPLMNSQKQHLSTYELELHNMKPVSFLP